MKWTSVKSETPDTERQVLVCYYEPMVVPSDPHYTGGTYAKEKKRWALDCRSWEMVDVTHWAEIEPPEDK